MAGNGDIIIGSGPGARRAAAAIGGALFDPNPSGERAPPPLPEGRGHAPSRWRAVIERAYGAAPVVDARALTRGLAVGGRVHPLPLSPAGVLSLFPPRELTPTVRGWAQARARGLLKGAVGGGREERSYADWVIYRFGRAAYDHLYAPYAALRWGDPEGLSVSVARLFHGADAEGDAVALGGSPAGGRERLAGHIPETHFGAIEGLVVEGKRVVALRREGGDAPVAGRVFCAASPATVAGWLGDALDPGVVWDASRLALRARVQVGFRGFDASRLPAEVHVACPGAPFFRLTRPDLLPGGAGCGARVMAHLSLPASDPILSASDADIAAAVGAAFTLLGLASPDNVGAMVWRLPDHDPAWSGPWHPVQNRLLEALGKLGVYLVGRAGTYRLVDPGTELAFAEALAAGDQSAHELQRSLLDPPVLLPSDSPSIGRFVAA